MITISLHTSVLTALLIVVMARRTYQDIEGQPGSFRGAVYCTEEFCVTGFYGLPYAEYADGVFGIGVKAPANLGSKYHCLVLFQTHQKDLTK